MSKAWNASQMINGNESLLEAMKKVDGDGSGLDADLLRGLPADLLGIGGNGYSWYDETNNRSSGTTYTNTYGKPIMIICDFPSSSTEQYLKIFVDGIQIYEFQAPANTTSRVGTFIVPNGSTYKFEDNYSPKFWFELK